MLLNFLGEFSQKDVSIKYETELGWDAVPALPGGAGWGGAVPGGLPVAPPAGRATGIDGNNLVAGETRGS